jgi:hypothetical protein
MMAKHPGDVEVFLDEQVITDSPIETPTTEQTAEPVTDAELAASDYAVPGKKLLPINTKAAAKKAWSQVAKTDDLTPAERRSAYRRILARLKKLGVDIAGYRIPKAKTAMTDAEEPVSTEWPSDLSLEDFRACLRAELKESYPKFNLIEVYPGKQIITAWRSSYYDDRGDWCWDNHTYTFTYEITEEGDGDGDTDIVNIKFGEPKISIMVPKVIEDEVTVEPGHIQVLSDEAEIRANSPLRFRLPGPRANTLNSNNRIYPRQVLLDAIERAKPLMRSGQMFSYMGHPPSVKLPDGTVNFKAEMPNRVAMITDWFMDEVGQTWLDRTIIRTHKGIDLEANIRAKAAVATSVRARGATKPNIISGRSVDVATWMDLVGDDFVENPALKSTWAQAQILTDEAVSNLIETALESFDFANNLAQTINDSLTDIAPVITDTAVGEPAAASTSIKSSSLTTLPDNNVQATNPMEATVIMDKDKNVQTTPAQPAQAEPETTQPTAPAGVMLDAESHQEFQNFLAERKAGKAKAAVGTFLDDALAGQEATLPSGTKRPATDLSRFSAAQISDIRVMCDSATPDTVEALLASSIEMMDKFIAREKLAGRGYQSSAAGQTVPQIQITDEAQPWRIPADKLIAVMNEQRRRVGKTEINQTLRNANQPFIDSVINGMVKKQRGLELGLSPLMDSEEAFLDDSASLANLLQQPLITPASAVLIMQMYWDLTWLSECSGIGPDGFSSAAGTDIGFGENLRIPVEPRKSGRMNLVTKPSQGIETHSTRLRWLNFTCLWRKLATDIQQEALTQLSRGPAKYEAMGRQLYLLATMYGENIDLTLAEEHYQASDEFNPTRITDEAYVDGDRLIAGTLPAVYGGGNILQALKMKATHTVGSVNNVARPIVKPRHYRVIQEDGQIQPATNVILNPIVVTLGGTPLVRGELAERDGKLWIDPDPEADTDDAPVYAVDYENGYFLFSVDAGINAGNIATVAIDYSYATNITWFDLTGSGTATDLAIYYDSVLRLIDKTAASLGSHPRFKPPTDAIWTLNNANYAMSARQAAQLFKPDGVELSVTAGKPSRFGRRGGAAGVDFSKVNTPLRHGDTRVLLKSGKPVHYGIQYPFQIEGPMPKTASKIVAGKVINLPTSDKFWIAQQNSVVCTPVGFDLDSNNNPVFFNHPLHTIKFVGTATL